VKTSKKEKNWEEEFWDNYTPPTYVQNKYVWVAAALLSAGMVYYSVLYRDCIPQ
jgi:hypothetical protein